MTRTPIDPVEEDALGERLRAAIEALPARSMPIRAVAPATGNPASRPLRVAGFAAMSVAALVGALVLGGALAERRAVLTSPAPNAVAADRYGLIVQDGGPVVRAESDPAPIARLYQEPVHRGGSELWVVHAVSPDGRRVAYWSWTSGPPGLGSLALTRLAVFDAVSGGVRDLLSMSTEAGSGVVWSTDGSGLLIGVVASIGPELNGPNLARLRTIDLATGRMADVGPAIDPDGPSGSPFEWSTGLIAEPRNVTIRPLLWDRAADKIVALVAARNLSYASSVMIVERGVARFYPLEGQFLTDSIALSPDGKRLAGARTRDFALVVWDVYDYAKREEIVPSSGERILSLDWRPRTDQLFFMRDNALTTDSSKWSRLELWRPGVNAPRVVNATPGPAIMFRFDGSAYLMVRDLPVGSYDIIDADSGQTVGSIRDVRVAGTLMLPGQTPGAAATSSAVPIETATCRQSGYDGIVVGAFTLRAAELARQDETRGGASGPRPLRSQFRDYPADTSIVLCFFDGFIAAPGGPPGVSPATFRPYDRYVVTVDPSGQARLAVAGYRDRIVVAPQLP